MQVDGAWRQLEGRFSYNERCQESRETRFRPRTLAVLTGRHSDPLNDPLRYYNK
ncbi:hypothetical protein PA598K_04265 [Paenibacillus sp. 598K]|nr:hypothetical protein PA598K_04265 [Paenibacillus sp. 598K]